MKYPTSNFSIIYSKKTDFELQQLCGTVIRDKNRISNSTATEKSR